MVFDVCVHLASSIAVTERLSAESTSELVDRVAAIACSGFQSTRSGKATQRRGEGGHGGGGAGGIGAETGGYSTSIP